MAMHPNPLLASVLLGAGGRCPGLVGYDVLTDTVQPLLRLQARQSIYALARSPDNRSIAAGTKTGDIYILNHEAPVGEDLDNQHTLPIHNLSTPILAAVFLDQKTLAISDTAARCGICRFDQHDPVQWLETHQRIICALFCLNSRFLVGLSLSGELLQWNWSSGDVIKLLPIPALPEISAMVQPVYWPANESWAWPGQDGILVFYAWQQQKISTLQAHRGEVYAVTVHQEELLSIGRTDTCLKRWHTGLSKPIGCVEVASGIVAATCWARDHEVMLLFAYDTGKAGIYSLHENRLELCGWLPGEAYRIALGPDVQAYEILVRQQKDRQAQALAREIQGHIAHGKSNEVDHLYKQLIEMGYEHVARALQAEAARQNQDLIGELRAYTQLTQIIPQNKPELESTLRRYAQLLETIWQIQRACTIYEHLLQIKPHDPDYVNSLEKLSEHAGILKSGSYVIEAHIPLTTLAKAAMILGEQFTGRHLYHAIGDSISCGVLVSAEELIARYNHTIISKSRIPLPTAEQMDTWWLSSTKRYLVTMVLLRSNHPDLCRNVELGIKLHNVHLQTILEPVIVFNANHLTEHTPRNQHNSDLLEKLCLIEQDTQMRGWLETVYRHVRQAARQVITKAMAESIR